MKFKDEHYSYKECHSDEDTGFVPFMKTVSSRSDW